MQNLTIKEIRVMMRNLKIEGLSNVNKQNKQEYINLINSSLPREKIQRLRDFNFIIFGLRHYTDEASTIKRNRYRMERDELIKELKNYKI